MIGIEDFKAYINLRNDFNEYVDKLYDADINVINSPLVNFFYKMTDHYINQCFTKEGVDWIEWWQYEKQNNVELKAFDSNNNEIPTDTIEDLWNIISKYVKE